MQLEYQRWILLDAAGHPADVLVLIEDGAPLGDGEGFDCFPLSTDAAEAAWLRAEGPPVGGTWLEAADRALNGPAARTVRVQDPPGVRLVDATLIAADAVGWLQDAAGQSLSTSTITSTLLDGGGAAGDSLVGSEAYPALSGADTRDWALADLAGLGTLSGDAAPPIALEEPSDLPLSGLRTREWSLVDIAAAVAGSPATDDDPEPEK